MKRNGRPPKINPNKTSTLTIRVHPDAKKLIVEMADGYDMTLTEYILTLVQRDASGSPES